MTTTAEKPRNHPPAHRSRTIADEPLGTEEEVADRLRLKPGTLRAWRWRGQGPRFIRFGEKSIRYRWSDVDEWLDQQAAQGDPA